MFSRVSILGLGLIGGSIGLALRRSNAAQEVVGYDLREDVGERALQLGAVDLYTQALSDAVAGAEIVILATPVGPIQALLRSLAAVVSPGTVVTDVASTKAQVLAWADAFLPSSVAFVGGHPMAGKEVSGVDAADARLFKNRIYCLTPTPSTPVFAISKVSALIRLLGARLRFIDPVSHDEQVAGVSHLPFLASLALMETVATDGFWDEAGQLAASGFRDTTRLAAGSPEMYRDICLSNTEAIARQLDKYISQLQSLRERIMQQDTTLDETFAHIQQLRLQWQEHYEMSEQLLPSSQ